MAQYNRKNQYYDGSAARKIERKKELKRQSNLIRLNEKQLRKARWENINLKGFSKNVATVVTLFVLATALIFGQAQLAEVTERVSSKTIELEQLQSVGIQLEMQATSDMNIDEIEAFVKYELGMQKVNGDQITYVNVDREDVGEVVLHANQGFFNKIWTTLTSWMA